MDIREANIAKDKMIADVYSRAYAAALSCNDDGVNPAAEAKVAVRKFIEVMKTLSSEWMWYEEGKL